MASIDELRKRRFLFLKHVYEITGGSRFKHLIMDDVGNDLGLSKDETAAVCEYLVGEGLLKYAHLGGGIAITHGGVVEIESALAHPDQPTHYFPPVNVIHVQNMYQSQIQQGAVASSQTAVFSTLDPKAIAQFIAELKGVLSSLPLSASAKSEIQAEVATVDAQLSSPKPKLQILTESLKSIRTILEGVSANVLASQLLTLLSGMGI